MTDLLTFDLGDYTDAFQTATLDLKENEVMRRIWEHDHTVWQDDPTEITNRLGWLTIMDSMRDSLSRMQKLASAVKDEGFTNVLLVGMGGSSLAPEVFSNIFSAQTDGLSLDILDSTDPGSVLAYESVLDLDKTLFVVSTKSGGTAETLSFFKYFYNRELEAHGGDKEATGKHFVGITDPGSKLEGISERYHFRSLFINDPNIGGRYSVLSFFGLVPAALIGIDVEALLDSADEMAANCAAGNCPHDSDNRGGRLGAAMGALANAGRDKITFITSPALANYGDWVEQLIAESTGKDGEGIVPVVGEAIGTPDVYGDDRYFVYLRLAGDETHDDAVQALKEAGHPVITLNLADVYDVGGQFFLWELATAVSGYFLGIQPFDQPNVEAAKNLARAKIDEYMETGKLEQLPVAIDDNGIQVIGDVEAETAGDALTAFLEDAGEGAYISLHAYIQPTASATEALQALQTKLRDTTKLATTLGYGPRFLHSTGQLHKGDAGDGLFIQIMADMPQDADIPDEAGEDASGMSFGTLKEAQALGDRAALLEVDRAVIRFHLSDINAGLQTLTDSL